MGYTKSQMFNPTALDLFASLNISDVLNISNKSYIKLEVVGFTLKAYESDGTVIEYNLSGITWFHCSNNKLQTLPKLPNEILFVDCSYNNLQTISELPTELKILNCSYNHLRDLPTIPETLNTLQCSYNNLCEIKTLPKSLKYLLCDHNPLIFIVPWIEKLHYSEFPANFEHFFTNDNYSKYRLKYQTYRYLITYLALEARLSPSILSNDHFWFPDEI